MNVGTCLAGVILKFKVRVAKVWLTIGVECVFPNAVKIDIRVFFSIGSALCVVLILVELFFGK